jgi:hypothetical protein
MGCDIHGYIEVKKNDLRFHGFVEVQKYASWDDWDMAFDIKAILGRNYGMFGLLFGVRDDVFSPVAKSRGLPENVSDEVKAASQAWGVDGHSHSWITIQEINAINWDERSNNLSSHVYMFPEGSDEWTSGFGWSSALDQDEYDIIDTGGSIQKDGITYKRLFETKGDSLSGDWKLLFQIMNDLEKYYQAQPRYEEVVESDNPVPPVVYHDTSRVRLVVWFDN